MIWRGVRYRREMTAFSGRSKMLHYFCERSRPDVFALEIAKNRLSLIRQSIESQFHQYVVAPYMGRRAREEIFLLRTCICGRYQPLTIEVTPRFLELRHEKKILVEAGGRRMNSIQYHHVEHGSHFCSVVCDLCFS